MQALEKKKHDDEACGEIDTAHPGYLGSQDTFYVGTLKGVGRVYQQTYVDTCSKVAHAKLYTTKTPITAADLLNDRVLPFHEEHDLPVLRIMTDRGTEYCGRVDKHDFQLFLATNDIDHTKTKVKSPQTNGQLRAVPQDDPAGVLSGTVPQKAIRQHRGASGRSGSMAASLQPRAHASRQNVLRQNAHRNYARRERNLAGKVRALNLA
ncbi:integrase family protein [Puniceibacterium sp. IMCC21224]|nr:integrase family protein [Puniceibacterium sp. IMCC21224]